MNKRVIVFLALVCMGISCAKDFQAGLVLGGPDGLSLKSGRWHGAVGINSGEVYLHVDLVKNQTVKQLPFPLYVGYGVYLESGNSIGLGFRSPIGMEADFGDMPFEFFFEIVPTLHGSPKAKIGLGGALGLYYTL